MERFGWPMGPAYLMDVVGMDTGVHAAEVMAQGFPDRMRHQWQDTTQVLVANQRLGQKNGKGYYLYAPDKKGKPKKTVDPTTYELIKDVVAPRKDFSPDDIVARCMVPMVNEVARCLEEKIVGSPQEADMALLYGVGFPPFRGGACRYVDQLGAANFVATADRLKPLGKLYEAPPLLREMAASNARFYG
jgi:3-hydroxyacyl-CoA dehydrogenase/enoyl-CoA hydratase/3-hydroxybutyryl-CoA epimerase/enoyl-CoA isomerase